MRGFYHTASDRAIDDETIRLIATMPHLHTLALSPMPRVCFEPLLTLPKLTSLRMADSLADSTQLRLVCQLPALTALHVDEPQFFGERFRSLFASALLQHRLQLLTLRGWMHALIVSAVEFKEAFASMRRLYSLQFHWVARIDDVLPHVAHAPSLTALDIQPCYFQSLDADDSLPSVAVLSALLAAAPNLHCTLRTDVACLRYSQLSSEGRVTITHEPKGT
jgi:hypothetical protein